MLGSLSFIFGDFSCYYPVCWDQFNQLPARLLSWVLEWEETRKQMGLSWGQENLRSG
jgi:hypothetical protein